MLMEKSLLNQMSDFATNIREIRKALNQSLRGKSELMEKVLACILARGHLLLEDMPGLGKTTLAKALARAVGGTFARVQCTPDLLPGDITGFSVFNQKAREFDFIRGPVFADVLLADEINRTTPRTQSALLEAMAERQVTIDGDCLPLSDAFFVIATQNPVEHHGTYPLPEAQLDRFAMKLSVGYPSPQDEMEMLAGAVGSLNLEQESEFSIDRAVLNALQKVVAGIPVEVNVRKYLVDLATASRCHPKIALGLSPRGILTWQRIAQAWAFLKGRDFVIPDDIQEVSIPVLGVRIATSEHESTGIIRELMESVKVPF